MMEKKSLIKALGISLCLLITLGFVISCGATIRPVVQEDYDWSQVDKICTIGILDLERSREVARGLAHHLFEGGFPVVEKTARSVLEIYDLGRDAEADVIAYGNVTKIKITRSSNVYPPTTTKEVVLELQFIETRTQKRIWKGSGSLVGGGNVKDEFLIKELLGQMVAEIVPKWTEVTGGFTGFPMLKVGEKAPLFKVSDVKGNQYALQDHIGKDIVVLSFWSFFCEPCKRTLRTMNDIHRRYHLRRVNVVAVNLEGEAMLSRIKTRVYQERLEFTFLLDEPDGEKFEVADPYMVPVTPAVYIIGKSGKIVFARSGRVGADELAAAIEAELAKE